MPNNVTAHSFDRYQTDGGKAYHEAIHGGLGEYGYSLIAKRRASKIQPYILPTDKVLEYGVGPGWNLAKIKAWKLKGLDVSSVVRDTVEAQGIEFVEKISAEDIAAYDVVICSHVLEHVENPNEVLTTILSCLKPNGKALFFVPYDFARRFRKYFIDEPNHHLYSWCVQSFGNLVTISGFCIIEGRLRKFGYERIAAKWIERLRLPDWAYGLLLRIALFLKPEYEIVFVLTKPVQSLT
jgi:SAM-dependent methyltransferase